MRKKKICQTVEILKYYELFRKNPENIMSGIRRGAFRAIAAFAEGAAAEINEPLKISKIIKLNI